MLFAFTYFTTDILFKITQRFVKNEKSNLATQRTNSAQNITVQKLNCCTNIGEQYVEINAEQWLYLPCTWQQFNNCSSFLSGYIVLVVSLEGLSAVSMPNICDCMDKFMLVYFNIIYVYINS